MARRHRGTIEPRGADRWMVRVFLGRDGDGKRRYTSRTVRGGVEAARKALTALLSEVDRGTVVPANRLRVGEYLDAWLKGKIDVSYKTRVGYRRSLEYFRSTLGGIRLSDLRTQHVQDIIGKMQEQGLSPRTIELARTVIKSALEYAVRTNLLPQNPARYTRTPKKDKREPTVLTMDQIATLIEVTEGDRFHALWVLLLTTGLRPQEALGLTWADLTTAEEGGSLSIRRVLVQAEKGRTELVNTAKTSGSLRSIGIPATTIAALKTHRQTQRAEILKAGPQYSRADLIFANIWGRPLDLRNLRRPWKDALSKTEERLRKDLKDPSFSLPSLRLYDTRHSHLTALLAAGADIAWVAARAGHKDIKMTRDHYAHVMPETHRRMGEMTETLLSTARSNLKGNTQ